MLFNVNYNIPKLFAFFGIRILVILINLSGFIIINCLDILKCPLKDSSLTRSFISFLIFILRRWLAFPFRYLSYNKITSLPDNVFSSLTQLKYL